MKNWISPDIHPNAGIEVKVWLRNKETGKSVFRKAVWNRTHWSIQVDMSKYEIVGWSEE